MRQRKAYLNLPTACGFWQTGQLRIDGGPLRGVAWSIACLERRNAISAKGLKSTAARPAAVADTMGAFPNNGVGGLVALVLMAAVPSAPGVTDSDGKEAGGSDRMLDACEAVWLCNVAVTSLTHLNSNDV